MVAIQVLALLLGFQAKPVIEPAAFDLLFAKVTEIGEKTKLDPSLVKFFELEGAEAVSHSKFDSERTVYAVTFKRKKLVLFSVPEKPFPEFGKTWAYRVDPTGLVSRGGVCEPREAYKALKKEDAQKGAQAEADYWTKELKLSG